MPKRAKHAAGAENLSTVNNYFFGNSSVPPFPPTGAGTFGMPIANFGGLAQSASLPELPGPETIFGNVGAAPNFASELLGRPLGSFSPAPFTFRPVWEIMANDPSSIYWKTAPESVIKKAIALRDNVPCALVGQLQI